MEKKLIAFDDELFGRINEFSERYKKTFTESVRILIQLGLKTHYNGSEQFTNSMDLEIKKIKKELDILTENIEKKINILSAASKLFKGHVENRSIHLQD